MPYGDIPVATPTVGPEPPGLTEAVSQLFGTAPKPTGPPDPYAAITDEELRKLLEDTMRFCEPGREPLEWRWWQKLHYFLGNQWIYWNPSTRTFQDKRLAKWIPKPVTNKIDETVAAILAIMADISPAAAVRPVGTKIESQIAAQVAEDMAPLIYDEHELDEALWDADFWTVLLGDSYLHPHWDKAAGTKVSWQMDQCTNPACGRVSGPEETQKTGGLCPSCQSPVQPAVDPTTGQPIEQSGQIGKGRTLAVSPLELFLPLYAQRFDQVDRLVYGTWRPQHQIEAEVGSDISSKIQWTKGPEYRSLQLYRSLQTFPGAPFTPTAFAGSGMQDDSLGATEMHLWMKPSKQFERGLYMKYYGEKSSAVVARVTGTGPIPTQRLNGEPLWPWIHYPYRRTGGRLYSISAVDNILKKQDQLNQVDSMTQLTLNRMGNPVWLEPKGAEVERFTGEPGLIVKYQTVGAQNAKPERIAGENPPQSAFTLRQQHMADIEDLSGTHDVVKGSKPSGVRAYSALQLLVERSQSRFAPTFKSRGKAYAKWLDVAIEMERRHGPTTRVKNVQGPFGTWTHKIYQRADLTGEIDIRIEDGSTAPKTALGQRAAIEHLNQLGMINPQDSDQTYAIMQKFGTLFLVPSLDTAVKSALREQDAFEQWVRDGMEGIEQLLQYQQSMQQAAMLGMEAGPPPQISPLTRKPWHNDQVHLQENQKWMNSDQVMELIGEADQRYPGMGGALVEQLLGMHLQEHSEALMMQQMQQGAAPGGPEGEPAAGGDGGGRGAGRAMRNSNQESGGDLGED